MKRIGVLIAAGVLTAVMLAPAASAQTINPKSKDKVRWFNAPREIQILDERPNIRDFREAPAQQQGLQLPPGPQGFSGLGGGGAGALGDDGGGTNPAGGVPLGGGSGPGYRTDPGSSNPVPLPKADFGHQGSNIPARGMMPSHPLPSGVTTNSRLGLNGRLMPWARPTPEMAVPMPMARPNTIGRMAPRGPSAASYGGGYGAPAGGSSYGGGGASTAVRGKLLNQLR